MTENEAIERLQTLNIILTNKSGHKEDGIEKIFTFSDITAICKAIQALEEVQKYRAIGTVEEFKVLKEKNEPKKPIDKSKNPTDWHVMACPCCEHVFWNSGQFVRYQPKFCNGCGQALNWEEWE